MFECIKEKKKRERDQERKRLGLGLTWWVVDGRWVVRCDATTVGLVKLKGSATLAGTPPDGAQR